MPRSEADVMSYPLPSHFPLPPFPRQKKQQKTRFPLIVAALFDPREGKGGPSSNNAGFPLELAVDAMAAEVNLSATQQFFVARTPNMLAHVKDKWLAAWLMRAVSCCFQRDDGDASIR